MVFDLKQYTFTAGLSDGATGTSIVRLTDGATGTQLAKMGLAPGRAGESWNVENPAAVERVASSYIQAGSDVILTNTFCANRYALAGHGLSDKSAKLAEAGAVIARRAADAAKSSGREVKVFGSIGPTGKIVMTEEIREEDFISAFAETAEALAFGGVDAIVLETFNELDEARLALQAVRQATDLPAVVSMTFASGPDKTHTMMGNSPADLARVAKTGGAAAIGANCGAGPENYVAVARLLRQASDLPIWIKPNAGLPTVGPDGKTRFPLGPADFAAYTGKLIDAGANFLGGCCGTTPAHIEALRAAIDKRRK